MVSVPSEFQPLVQQAAVGTGLPFDVVAAQANAESGFNAKAVSSTGAEGWLQFEPSTYAAYAPKAGVPNNTEFNPADETKVYIAYMDALLKEEGGNVFKALEAYNAGPGNLGAGAGYASGILSAAGQSQSLSSSGGTGSSGGIQTAGITIPGVGTIPTGVNDLFGGLLQGLLSTLGLPSLKELFQRLGLILFGVGLIFVGIRILSNGNGGGGNKNNGGGGGGGSRRQDDSEGTETKPKKVEVKEEPSTKALSPEAGAGAAGAGGATESLGASEALEAAAVA